RDPVLASPLDAAGERMTRFLFGLWENPATRKPLLAVVRSAVTNEVAATVFRRLVASQLLRRIAGEIDAPDAGGGAARGAAPRGGGAGLGVGMNIVARAAGRPGRGGARGGGG
ncbi:TetR family transcriptional regulator, partial [Streptomyces sp. NPDC059374]